MANERMLLGLFEGSVTQRNDPENLGRVKIVIPGVIEPETPNWVWPLGASGGGYAQHGDFNPPPVGANVGIFFVQGSIDEPRYITGPWGAPNGVVDTPTGAAIDTDNDGKATRQNAVLEDAEWTIQRDSRVASKKYLIKHKSSSLAVLVDASNDKLLLVRDNSSEALVLGTSYRSAEVTGMAQLVTILDLIVTALNSVGADASFSAAFSAAAGFLTTLAGTAYPPAKTTFTSSDFAATATAYVSEKSFTE